MRLINVHTLKLESFIDEVSAPKYAILSHTWGSKEVQYLDLVNYRPGEDQERLDWRKIHLTCDQAKKDALDYAWVDTCCIDKSSSAELSEAINSMFKWYQKSDVCYVFMPDVQIHLPEEDRQDQQQEDRQEDQTSASRAPSQELDEEGSAADTCSPSTKEPEAVSSETRFLSGFRDSRWWTRGWTLQELLAPKKLLFYDFNWTVIGEKPTPASPTGHHPDLLTDITSITNIPSKVLTHERRLHSIGVAVKMSWASKRMTTRKEDIAYCLLGIFDINMPLLYGEGEKAFKRLQEEIIRTSADQSIFAWEGDYAGILAPSPAYFERSSTIVPRNWASADQAYRVDAEGLHITLRVWSRGDYFSALGLSWAGDHLAILDCADLNRPGHYICLWLWESNFTVGVKDPKERLVCQFIPGHTIEYIRESMGPESDHSRRSIVQEFQKRSLTIYHRAQGRYWPDHSPFSIPVQLLLPREEKATVALEPSSSWNNETTFLDSKMQNGLMRTIHVTCQNWTGCANLTLLTPFNDTDSDYYAVAILERCPLSGCKVKDREEHLQELCKRFTRPTCGFIFVLGDEALDLRVPVSWHSVVVVVIRQGPVGENRDGLRVDVRLKKIWAWPWWRLRYIRHNHQQKRHFGRIRKEQLAQQSAADGE